ncbi:MAG: hypothetical protein U5K69_12020 [Balneolaceae bacterium]|nr:hypothetical protein [Balneolaceae bacterium]
MNTRRLLQISKNEYSIGGQYHISKTGKLPHRIVVYDFDEERWQHMLEQIMETYEWEEQDFIHDEQHFGRWKDAPTHPASFAEQHYVSQG